MLFAVVGLFVYGVCSQSCSQFFMNSTVHYQHNLEITPVERVLRCLDSQNTNCDSTKDKDPHPQQIVAVLFKLLDRRVKEMTEDQYRRRTKNTAQIGGKPCIYR